MLTKQASETIVENYPFPSPKRRRDWLRRSVIAGLVIGDALALAAAFLLAYTSRFEIGLPLLETPPYERAFYLRVALQAIPLYLGILALNHLYDHKHLFAGFREYARIVNAGNVGTMAVVFVTFVDVTFIISRAWLVLTWVLTILAVAAWRFLARRVMWYLWRHGYLLTTTLIVGANEEGQAIADQLQDSGRSGNRVVGYIDDERAPGTELADGLRVIGRTSELRSVVERHGVESIVVAMTALPREDFLDLYRTFGQEPGLELRFSSGLFEILTTGVVVQEGSRVPLITPERVRITGLDAFLKTLLDGVVSIVALFVLWPVMLAIAVMIRRDSPGPVIYRREVLGRGGKPFYAFKFRTMVRNADRILSTDPALRRSFDENYKLEKDPRITRIGAKLRRYSLDELPQLFNVLRGEMSWVGPRMIAPDEASRYGKWRLNLLTVRPGITGPWQVQGRSELPYQDRIRLNMNYIRNYSIWLDLQILMRTVMVVFRGRGAY